MRRVLYGKPATALDIGLESKEAARENDFELQVVYLYLEPALSDIEMRDRN